MCLLCCSGRDVERVSPGDGGGAKFLNSIQASATDQLIPVIVDRRAAASVPGGCLQLCYPRTVTLDIGYQQRNKQLKRIVYVNLIFDDFDTNYTVTDYKLKLGRYKVN